MAVLTLPTSEGGPPTVRARALVFADPLSRMLESDLRQVAPSNATVLITGETGTGKEIVARLDPAPPPTGRRSGSAIESFLLTSVRYSGY